jgi:hypothetical protein
VAGARWQHAAVVGYGFDLVHVPRGLGRDERRAAVARAFEELEPIDEAERTQRVTMPPSPEQSRLAGLLKLRFPRLRVTHESASHIELTERNLWTQISIFENAAGIGMHPGGFSAAKYIEAARLAWDCLGLLEREASFATYDPQLGRVLDLATDFETMLAVLSGERTVKKYREMVALAEQSYSNQVAVATKAGSGKPYSATARYVAGDLVEHPKFGAGVVQAVAPARVTILFDTGTKVLVSG